MKSRLILALGVTTSAIVLAGIASAASAAETLKFTTVERSSSESATGFTFKEDVYQGGKKVGRDRGVCTLTPQGSREPTGARCRVTLFLPEGRLILSATISFEKPGGPLTVIGGTGDYEGATGTGTHRDAGNEKTKLTINLA